MNLRQTALLLVLSIGSLPTSDPMIRWEVDPSGLTSGVSVVGLPVEVAQALNDPDRAPILFPVRLETVEPRPADRPNMLGTYRVEGNVLRFTPRYPFDRGRTYLAEYRPVAGLAITSKHLIPKPERPPTVVNRVTPSGSKVPENLLKFYLTFSSPMSRGEFDRRVRLVRDNGSVVDRPFLQIAEELWDPSGTRLTVLIDPGRIKRGLIPREEFGPVLQAGVAYTLVIDADWPDADGSPLKSAFRKRFVAGPADETQPDPAKWTIKPPKPQSLEPLVITFPDPLDGALIESALTLVDARGFAVPGKLAIEADETRWIFTPEIPWTSGDYQLEVDADLEDLAGNSILRPFEVDVQRDTPLRPEARTIRLPIAIRAKSP